MSECDPFDVVFGQLEKLGPSSRQATLAALQSLPRTDFGTIVDAGCGTGAQTLLLAKTLQQHVHAIDLSKNFLARLTERAGQMGLGGLITTHCVDMAEIPQRFPKIDLLWSEGAAYSIGFENALEAWRDLLRPDGFLVVSELCWTGQPIPPDVQEFFAVGYPEMKTLEANEDVVQDAGYELLGKTTLSNESWTDEYYDILEPQAEILASHVDERVRDLARGIVEEIEVHRKSQGCCNYVLFTLRPTQ